MIVVLQVSRWFFIFAAPVLTSGTENREPIPQLPDEYIIVQRLCRSSFQTNLFLHHHVDLCMIVNEAVLKRSILDLQFAPSEVAPYLLLISR